MTREELDAVLTVAIQAISTCNTQPWRFRYTDGVLEVFMLRTKNFFLKLEGNAWLELGAMLENLTVGAAAKGYQTKIVLFDRSGLDAPSAKVTFVRGEVPAVNLEAVMKRCTNRNPYATTPLPPEVQASILAANDDPTNLEVRVLLGSKKNTGLHLLSNLERLRLGNYLLLREVLPYLRADEAEVATTRDRLDTRTLGLDTLTVRIIRWSKHFPRLMAFFFAVFSMFTSRHETSKATKTLQASGALIAFSIRARDQSSYVSLGRVAQRILNTLTAQNVQSYTIVTGLYLLDLLKENLEIYSNREQRLLLRIQYEFQSFFGFADRRLALFIRAGYAEPPAFRSLRRPVESFYVDERGNRVS